MNVCLKRTCCEGDNEVFLRTGKREAHRQESVCFRTYETHGNTFSSLPTVRTACQGLEADALAWLAMACQECNQNPPHRKPRTPIPQDTHPPGPQIVAAGVLLTQPTPRTPELILIPKLGPTICRCTPLLVRDAPGKRGMHTYERKMKSVSKATPDAVRVLRSLA